MGLMHYRDPTSGVMIPIIGAGGATDHGELTGLADDDHAQYLLINGSKSMTGILRTPDLAITGTEPEPGLVWTAEDIYGNGAWHEPSALVVAETSDPVLINWFDLAAEGWVMYHSASTGTMVWEEMPSPSMPGVLSCTGDVWAEWQFGNPMVYEPGALYRVTVRARLENTASLSFGFQCYDAATPANVVDRENLGTTTKPHWCAVGLVAGDDSWIENPPAPGGWVAWTGYISSHTDGVAAGIPPIEPPIPEGWPPECAPAERAVQVAVGSKQWRPVFHATGGRVWVDAIEVHRLDRSLELPDGIRAATVTAESVNTESLITTNLVIPPSTEGHLLTAVDDAGGSEWQYPPITVTEGPPPRTNLLTVNQESVETDLTGWGQAWQCTLSRVASTVHGAWGLRLTNTTGTSMAAFTPTSAASGTTTPCEADKTYTISAVITAGTCAGKIYIDWRDAAGVHVGLYTYSEVVLAGESRRVSVSAVAPAGAVVASFAVYGQGVTTAGQWVEFDSMFMWEGTGPSNEPDNPLTINVGTLYGRHSGSLLSLSASATITATAMTRVPGSKALKFTLDVPAMVSVQMQGYVGQSASSTVNLYYNVGVKDEAGTDLWTDDFAGPVTHAVHGGSLFRSATGGASFVPFVAFWRRLLPPGTYTVFPASYVLSVDAGSNKTMAYAYMNVDIDPDVTYLPGSR